MNTNFLHYIFEHYIFLNTNRTNYTNNLLHTDLTDHTDSCSQRCAHGF